MDGAHHVYPGRGDSPLLDGLRVRTGIGVEALVGPEVFGPSSDHPSQAALELYSATADLLRQL